MQNHLVTMHRLAGPAGDGRGVYCTDDGVFIGPDVALIEAVDDAAGGRTYRVRPAVTLAGLLSAGYGEPVDIGLVIERFESIAAAMNKGAWALAHIQLVHLRLPPLADGGAACRIATADWMLKANFNSAEPRDDRGRWTTGGGDGGGNRGDIVSVGYDPERDAPTAGTGDQARTADPPAAADQPYRLPNPVRSLFGPKVSEAIETALPYAEELARLAPGTGEALAVVDALRSLKTAQEAFASGDTATGAWAVAEALGNLALAAPGLGEIARPLKVALKAGLHLLGRDAVEALGRAVRRDLEGSAVRDVEGRLPGEGERSSPAPSTEEAESPSAGRESEGEGDTADDELPLQNHHFATPINKKYVAEFEKIIKKYKLDLNDPWNIEELPHLGRHPDRYHNFVLDGMHQANSEANGDAEKFLELFDKYVKDPVREKPSLLRRKGWER